MKNIFPILSILALAACTSMTADPQIAEQCKKQGYTPDTEPFRACVQQLTDVKREDAKIAKIPQRQY